MKFTCGAKSLASARRDFDRRLTTFSKVNTPSTNKIDVRFIGSFRVVSPKNPFYSFVPGFALANPISSPELLQRSTRAKGLRRFSHFCVSARRSAPFFGKFRIYPALIGIFFTVDRRNVRWVFIEIGSPDPQFLAVRVDPPPHAFA